MLAEVCFAPILLKKSGDRKNDAKHVLDTKLQPNEINRLVLRNSARSGEKGRSQEARGLFQRYPPEADIH